MKKWIIKNPNNSSVQDILKNSVLSKLCAEVLVSRGIDNIKSATEFMVTEELSDPFSLKDMDKAVEIINNAVEEGKSICIFGDYDCDGITSTVMIYTYLQFLGANVSYYIPERDEGYGMNKKAINYLAENDIELIITVDNGISAIEEAQLISDLGIQLVITDHHQPGNILPKADAIVNPHQKDCPSIFKNLCGAGVVLKLLAALDEGSYENVFEQFGDIAAIGTIADVVSLKSENRYIVENGLKLLKNTENLGLIALMKEIGIYEKELSSTSVAFMLAPKINAAGRFASPKIAVDLFISEDIEEANILAKKLNQLNDERKKTEDTIVSEIEKQINENPDLTVKRVLVLSGENWHHGVIGIIASRIVERFGKPCFIITEEGEFSRGSVRSFGNFSVYECLAYCSDLLEKYGGHLGAGGFSLKTEKIDLFKEKIEQYSKEFFEEMPVFSIEVDKLLLPDDLKIENVEGLSLLEPFGEGNRQPLFVILSAVVTSVDSISNGAHTKLQIKYGEVFLSALIFNVKYEDIIIKKDEKWDFIVSLEINNYMNKKSISLFVKDFRRSGIKQERYFAAKNTYEKYKRDEILPKKYYEKICPSREEMISIYKALPEKINMEHLYMSCVNDENMNYCKMKLCLDIFSELELINQNEYNMEVNKKNVTQKTDLESSDTLKKLKENVCQK
jgi:single-stranded-DNA-specific exonuclease